MRDKILQAAEEIVQAKGLDAVSFQQLANSVGLSKASVFHHFRTKEALAQALIGQCRSKYGLEYATIAEKDKAAPKKLRKIAKSFDKSLKENRLCLLAALGSSYTTLSPNLQEEMSNTAEAAIAIFAGVFDQGRTEKSLKFNGSSEEAARSFLAMLQGMQQMARYSGVPENFMGAVDAYLKNLEK
ncbi:MAG: TetR/AcrR family transcriptional regulator [Opitutales bacterium]